MFGIKRYSGVYHCGWYNPGYIIGIEQGESLCLVYSDIAGYIIVVGITQGILLEE